MPENKCTVPPTGWSCSRAKGHDGPCAASPVAEVAAPLPEPTTLKYQEVDNRMFSTESVSERFKELYTQEADGMWVRKEKPTPGEVSPLPEIASPDEFCSVIAPGKTNAKKDGCIKLAGHEGYHLNGKNMLWRPTPSPLPLGEPADLELRKIVRRILNFGRKTPGNLPQFDAAMDEAFAYMEKPIAALATKAVPITNDCDVCCGDPLPSGKQCICGGSGRSCDEKIGLRQEIIRLEEELEEQLKAVSIGEGELPPLEPFPNLHNPDVCDCDLVGLENECTIRPTLNELIAKYGRTQQRERQLLQSQQREREWHSIKEQALTKMEEQRNRAELAEARLRSQERPEDAWNRAVKAGSAAGSRGQILPPYTPPK